MNDGTAHHVSETNFQEKIILIIDDNPANLGVLAEYLEAYGFEISVARNGQTGLEKARFVQPALILLDVVMPGIDGFETCRRLKASEETHNIPVVFMTALTETEGKIKGFQAGAVDYITKPFHREEVLARVTTHLRLRELTEQLEHNVQERTRELTLAKQRLEQEIVEHKQADEALRKHEALLTETQRLTKVGGWEYDVGTEKVFWTDEVYRIHEIPCTPEIDHVSESLKCYRPEDRPIISHAFQKAVEEGEPFDLEFQFTTYRGNVLWIRTTAKALREEGRIVRVLGNIMDITERKQTEEEIRTLNTELEERVRQRTAELETINTELNNFAYVVSHDLKSPLRGISRLANWLVSDYADVIDDYGQEMATLLISRVVRMDNLIEGILNYSRIGRLEQPHETIVLTELVHEAIDLLNPPNHIHITVDTELPVIKASRTRMIQVFQNLISNAITFMDKPHGEIHIQYARNGSYWLFSVTDNGPGIEKRYANKIFQIFQTLHPRDELESTGIGLTLVKKIVELYGGEVWVESTVGKGSTFFFTLPKSQEST